MGKIGDKSPLFVIDIYNHIQAVKEVACLAIPEDIVATFLFRAVVYRDD